MRAIIGSLLGIVIVAVVVIIVTDVASAPPAQRTQCVLQRRILLPDVCISGCPGFPNCTVSTRPYLIFWTQSATCMDAIICPP